LWWLRRILGQPLQHALLVLVEPVCQNLVGALKVAALLPLALLTPLLLLLVTARQQPSLLIHIQCAPRWAARQ
jgi:hypothetical protein